MASDPPPYQSRASASGHEPSAEQTERIASAIETYARQREASDTQQDKNDRKIQWWSRVSAISLIAYTLITIFVLISGIRSIQEARRATHYASRAAAAATDQAKIARDVEERQLRAYVSVEPNIELAITGNPNLKDFSIITAIIRVRNSGQTPAYKLYFDRLAVSTEIGPPFGKSRCDMGYEWESPSELTLGPGQIWERQVRLDPLYGIDNINLSEFALGKQYRIFACGEIFYATYDKSSLRHTFFYAGLYNWHKNTGGKTIADTQFYEGRNDSD